MKLDRWHLRETADISPTSSNAYAVTLVIDRARRGPALQVALQCHAGLKIEPLPFVSILAYSGVSEGGAATPYVRYDDVLLLRHRSPRGYQGSRRRHQGTGTASLRGEGANAKRVQTTAFDVVYVAPFCKIRFDVRSLAPVLHQEP